MDTWVCAGEGATSRVAMSSIADFMIGVTVDLNGSSGGMGQSGVLESLRLTARYDKAAEIATDERFKIPI